MRSLDDCVLTAMDCKDRELLPYLPYILQDFWEIGSEPEVMIRLIKKHLQVENTFNVLDLGCGKGAVSVTVAKKFKCECFGIDAIPDFISFSASKADEYGVGNLCKFEVGDIREMVKTLGKYDVIIIGAIGQVFGNYYETLTILNNNLKDEGVFIIDDGYIDDESAFKHDQVYSKSELNRQFTDAGMQLIDEYVASEEDTVVVSYEKDYDNLLKRCEELIELYPDKAEIFSEYSNQQRIEYNNLKNGIRCSTMVVKRKQ